MSYQNSLPNLNTNEAIADAVYRSVTAFDRNDFTILESAITKDAYLELAAGPNERTVIEGISTLKTQLFDHIGPMDTTHMVSNVRVNYKAGDSVASLTAYALAQHCPPGRGKDVDGPKFIAGSEYLVDLVLDHGDGLWKVKKWVVDIIWRQGDPSVMQRPSSDVE
jgi:hypothetical protein